FETAKNMVEASPALRKRVQVYRRSLVVPKTGSIYKVLSSDAPHQHGLNAHAVVFDELHAQPDRELWDVMASSMGARRQPLMLAITTAGFDKNSICYEVWSYAQAVAAGTVTDPTFYAKIYAASPKARWDDPKTWAKANPSLGATVTEEFLQQEAERARHSPAYQNTFRRLYLNQWTEQETRWLDLDRWDACAGVVDPASLAGQECFGGLDLSSTTDLTAFVLVFPRPDGSYVVLPEFWAPEATATEAERRDRAPYTAWAREGYLHLTEGNAVDYAAVADRIRELGERYRIREIAYDRWNASMLVQQLQADGATVIPTGMGFASLSAPSKLLETLLLQGKLHHGGHPVLRWCAGNVAAEQDAAGNIKPSKAKSRERIDGITALVLALSRAAVQPQESPYEERGVLIL
ncbi:MAG: terminase large subunit, partial [Bacillota bacterium]